MRRTPRSRTHRAGAAAAMAFAVLAGAFGAPAASGGQPVPDGRAHESAPLRYRCETETGQRDLRVQVSMSLPRTVSVGGSVEPAEVEVRLELGEQIVRELADRGAGTVTGTTTMTVLAATVARQETERAGIRLSDLAIAETPLPRTGPLTLTAAGNPASVSPVSPVPSGKPGELTVSAGGLTLLLGWQTPEPAPEEPGAGPSPPPTTNSAETRGHGGSGSGSGGGGAAAPADGQPAADPPATAFDCVPEPGQEILIGTVAVSGNGAVLPDPGSGPGGDGGGKNGARENGEAPIRPADQPVELPSDCDDFANENYGWCAYLGGYTNIDPLGSAARIEPGIVNLAVPVIAACDDGSEWFWFCQTAAAELRYDGEKQLPPTRNSFHAFDFMPAEATMELTQVGDMTIDVRAQVISPYDGSVVAHATLGVRVYDVTVNGEPMEVGDDCRTVEPITVALTADYPGEYNPSDGGFLDGYTDIPRFSGCGVNENLDPLLTGLISGTDNYVKMTQGRICDIRTEQYCPPQPPELQR